MLAPLLELHPDLIPQVVSWTDSPNLWVRRGATVAFVPLVSKQKRFLNTAYRISTRLLDDREDLMHKAVGLEFMSPPCRPERQGRRFSLDAAAPPTVPKRSRAWRQLF